MKNTILGEWTNHAACKGKTALFFPEQGDMVSYRQAVAICATCPVIEDCNRHIEQHGERFGIWAGTNAARRQQMRNPDSNAQWNRCGTAKRYQAGCRCDACREAFRMTQRRWRNRNNAVTPDVHDVTMTTEQDTDNG